MMCLFSNNTNDAAAAPAPNAAKLNLIEMLTLLIGLGNNCKISQTLQVTTNFPLNLYYLDFSLMT